jgi:FkbM family methyltransferase
MGNYSAAIKIQEAGEGRWLRALRWLVRLYLSRFPLRNGKGRLYRTCQERLLPPARWQTIKVRQGFRLRLDLMDPAQRQLYFFGEYDERHEIRLLQRLLLPGDCFWDVGANIGVYTLTAALLVGPTGRVVAFEPAAPAWQALNDNVALNPSPAIRLVRLALSDRSGEATLHRRAAYADGGASLIHREGYHQETERVATQPVDDFLAQSGERPPTFVKIDVEGHEANVLAGAQRLLAGPQPPLLLIEMNDPATLGPLLQSHGYQGIYRHRRRWRFAADPRRAPSRNMLWFRLDSPTHRDRLPFLGLYACTLMARGCRF